MHRQNFTLRKRSSLRGLAWHFGEGEGGSNNFLKVVVVGSARVGKTNVLSRLLENEFAERYSASIGHSFSLKTVSLEDGSDVLLQLWDTAGRAEAASSRLRSVYARSDLLMCVVDITQADCLAPLDEHYARFVSVNGTQFPLLVVSNKMDLEEERELAQQDIDAWLDGKPNNIKAQAHMSAATGEYDRNILQLISDLVSEHQAGGNGEASSPKSAHRRGGSTGAGSNAGAVVHHNPTFQADLSGGSGSGGGAADAAPAREGDGKDENGAGVAGSSTALVSTPGHTQRSYDLSGNTGVSPEVADVDLLSPSQLDQDALDSANRTLDDFLRLLIAGLQVFKFARNGTKSHRVIWLAPTIMRVFISRNKSSGTQPDDKGFYVADIAEVRHGRNSHAFQTSIVSDDNPDYCFSVITSERTFDLATASRLSSEFMCGGFRALADAFISSFHKSQRAKSRIRGKPTSASAAVEAEAAAAAGDTGGVNLFAAESPAALHLQAPPTSPEEQRAIERIVTVLKKGMQVQKHNRAGDVNERVLWMNEENGRIYLAPSKMPADMDAKGIDIRDISEIRPGIGSYNFMRSMLEPDQAERCFSIIGSERIMAIEMPSREARDMFISQLQALVYSQRPEIAGF